ncbi:MAG: O-antigen ligase family protein [Roseateles sp.]
MFTVSTATSSWNARIIYATLFMLPVAGISVRHWLSGSFLVLTLLSLPQLFRKHGELAKEERVFLAICAAFFAVFIVSALINEWTQLQTRYLGKEIRFLLIIPVYLMLRHYPDAGRWLLRGAIVGAFVMLAQALLDIYVLRLPRAEGAYSPNLLGPVAVLVAFWVLTAWTIERQRIWHALIPFSFVAALAAATLSGSRGAYLAIVAVGVVWIAMRFQGRQLVLAGVAAIAIMVSVFSMSDTVAKRTVSAVAELRAYMRTDDPRALEGRFNVAAGRLGPVSTRLEMWRVSTLLFRDDPVWGIGRGNYVNRVGAYVERGLVHPEVAEHSHPHNAYLELLVSKGVVGLVVFAALLFYPLAYFVRTSRFSPDTAMLGVVHLTGFAVLSLTDASPFIKGNFISIFLLCLAVFFAWHVRRVHQG